MTAPRLDPVAGPSVCYEIRVAGHLDDHWATWIGGSDLVRHHDGTTSLTVEVADQAQLHGALAGIRDIGVGLLSLRVIHGGRGAARAR